MAGESTYLFECPRCGVILECAAAEELNPQQCPSCAAQLRLHPDPYAPRWRKAELADDSEIDLPTPVHAYAANGLAAPQIETAADGSVMIVCPKCAARSEADANRCRQCGAPFSVEAVHSRRTLRDVDISTWAVVFSMMGTVCFVSILPALIGVVLSIRGYTSDDPRVRHRSVFATITGAIGFAGGMAYWLRY